MEISLHYYQHHIGDYRRDTAHLSLMEHGIYRQLLDLYYLGEQPIPKETGWVFRRLSAKTDAERSAVECVLRDFFIDTDEGWRHQRCDAEIEAYQRKVDANRENGKHGGRPPKTQSVSVGLADQNPAQIEQNLNQEPLTINQEPKKRNTRSQPLATPEGVSESVWADFIALRKAKKAPVTQAAVEGIRREADKVWWSLEEALKECCMRGWVGFKSDWIKADKQSQTSQPASFAERDEIARRSRWEEMTGRKWPTNGATPEVIDITPIERLTQ